MKSLSLNSIKWIMIFMHYKYDGKIRVFIKKQWNYQLFSLQPEHWPKMKDLAKAQERVIPIQHCPLQPTPRPVFNIDQPAIGV